MPQLPVVIVLAAGRGERFTASGGSVHKLQALLAGKPVLDHVLDAVRASGLPFHTVHSHPTNFGMGDSIAAGVKATPNASGWLILPADLPLIQSATLQAIALELPCAVTVPLYQGQRGHPVCFAAACGPELMKLKGMNGAASVLRSFEAVRAITLLEVNDIGCVTDIDTVDDLRRAELLHAQRQKLF